MTDLETELGEVRKLFGQPHETYPIERDVFGR